MKKLYRSRTDKIIGGVAAGMAHYFDLDIALVRLFWLLFVFMGGIGLPVYIVAWIIIPEEPYHGAARVYNRGYPEYQEPRRYQEPGGYQEPSSAGSDNDPKSQRDETVDSGAGLEGVNEEGVAAGDASESASDAHESQEFQDSARNPEAIPGASDAENYSQERTNQALGLLLVVVGLAFLIRDTITWDIFRYVWPTLFIVLGVYILYSSRRG